MADGRSKKAKATKKAAAARSAARAAAPRREITAADIKMGIAQPPIGRARPVLKATAQAARPVLKATAQAATSVARAATVTSKGTARPILKLGQAAYSAVKATAPKAAVKRAPGRGAQRSTSSSQSKEPKSVNVRNRSWFEKDGGTGHMHRSGQVDFYPKSGSGVERNFGQWNPKARSKVTPRNAAARGRRK